MLEWNAKYYNSIHLYGHIHGTLSKYDKNAIEVSVDVQEYKPISFGEIKNLV